MAEFLNLPIVFVIKSIIDILAVAYLIYFLYSLFEDTNSINIMKGFIFIIAVSLIANQIGLETLAWVFQYVVSYIVILMVVLFQPEIRRILSRVGRSGLRAIRQKISQETMTALTEAVFTMSENRTGALIIIERNVGLRDLIEGATLLDASVVSDLLVSIFQKSSPLHDGALIIDNDKIVAARVIVPSIMVGNISRTRKKLGTRHRAGIAVTVDTDAISIIVSEETGKVSVASEGKLEQNLSEEKLIRRVNEILRPT